MDRVKASRDQILVNREMALLNDEKKIRAEELTIASREVEFRVLKRMSALRESEERGNFFIDNVREYAIIFFDVHGNISTWNSGAEHIKQYKSEEILGKNFSIFFTDSDRKIEKPQALLNKAVLDGQTQDEGWRVKKGGTLLWAKVTLISLRKNDGTHYGFVEIAHDLTEHKRTQEEINNLNQILKEKFEKTEKLANDILNANKDLAFQNEEKEKRASELVIANRELAFQNNEKEKRAAELVIANKELAFQNEEKENRASELIEANKELAFQNHEKEKRADELIIANQGLAFQNEEKEKRASELVIANKELAFQNAEKEKRASELAIANRELAFQNNEKEKRAAELAIANKELAFQNEEKENRAAELIEANKELAFQNCEKEKRADELIIANKELAFQSSEKEKRAAELAIANQELAFQNEEKEKRAAELIIANKELAFQNVEKEKRAAELTIANTDLAMQYEILVKREAENKELEAFCYSISHDLRAPLRHLGGFVDLLHKNNAAQLDAEGLRFLSIISESSLEMGKLIDALLNFSRLNRTEFQQTTINSKKLVTRIINTFSNECVGRNIDIRILEIPDCKGDENLIQQVWVNLISNAIKYTRKKDKAIIEIAGTIENNETVFYIKDNGAGFNMKYVDKLFGVFQRLHKAKDFEGIGIGLANVNRILTRHGGKCWAIADLDNGAKFFFSLPKS